MDPISAVGLAASVVQLIDVTAKAVRYFNEVKDAPKERAKLAREATGLLSLLTDLRYRIEDVDSKVSVLCCFVGPMLQIQDSLLLSAGLESLSGFFVTFCFIPRMAVDRSADFRS